MGIFNFFKKTTNQKPEKFSFETSWKIVKEKESKNLIKDAWNEVKIIMEEAKKQKNYPQLIKTYIFSLDYQNTLVDDGFYVELQEMENKISEIPEPYKSVMHSILGQIYVNYIESEYYKISNRSDVEDNDVKNYSTKQISKAARQHFEESIKNEDLKKVKTLEIKDLLQSKNLEKNYEPTLYAFLMNRALDKFYQNDMTEYEVFDDNFDESNNELLSDYESFINLKFDETKYPESNKLATFKIYQKLIEEHKENDNLLLIVNDLKRLKYYHFKSNSEESDTLFISALKKLENKFENDGNCCKVKLEIAKYYYKKGNYIEAHKKCDEIIKNFPKTEESKEAQNTYIHNIEIPQITCYSDDYISPKQNIDIKLEYKNVDKIFIRIFKIDNLEEFKRENDNKKLSEKLKKESSKIPYYELEVKRTNDYKTKEINYQIPKQNYGYYVIYISEEPNFEGKIEEFKIIQITDITTVTSKNEEDNSLKIKVLDRFTGESIQNAKIKIFGEEYQRGEWKNKELAEKQSDANGDCIFRKDDINFDGYNIKYTVEKDSDNFKNLNFPRFYRKYEEKIDNHYKIFTDRALYRPGQTVYLKVIGFSQLRNDAKVLSGEEVEVEAIDINDETIFKGKVKLNDYGSANCKFNLGNSVPLGKYYIKVDSEIIEHFQVEEYKLPTFEITAESPENEIVLNSNVKIKGNATTYSGVKLDRAKVKYEITRSPQFRGWWNFFYHIKEKQIANGETVTNENGNFEIDFVAKPDIELPKDNYLTFTYKVKIDVTDINGETQSTTTYCTVGYAGLFLNRILEKDTYFKNRHSFDNLTVNTENASGKHVDANVKVKVVKLKNFPTSKVWNYKTGQNDAELIPSVQKYEELKETKTIKEFEINTAENSKVNLSLLENCEDGNYMVVLTTKDKNGIEIKSESRFTLISEKSNKADFKKYFWSNIKKSTCEVGDTARIIVGSSMENVNCYYEIFTGEKVIKKETKLILNNNSQTIEIPIHEQYRGGISARFFFVKNNNFVSKIFEINVPFTNKKIDIKFESFRDKLEPGENETIKLKLLDNNLKPIDAELLATMYDESMDAILRHSWYFDILKNNSNCSNYESKNYYNSKTKVLKYVRENWYNYNDELNLSLNWFDHEVRTIGKPLMMGRGFSKLGKRSAVVCNKLEMCEIEDNVCYDAAPLMARQNRETNNEDDQNFDEVKIRKNFAETAFFSTNLVTDKNGEISLQFTIPETLTKWHFLSLAHTKDMRLAQAENHLITQKLFMVEPNLPRFFMEGDEITIPVKISNLSDKNLKGKVKIEVLDAQTEKPITDFGIDKQVKEFDADPEKTILQEFKLRIPKRPEPVIVKVVGISGTHSDGMQKYVPVLTTRTLITESQTLYVRANQTKNFTINSLLNQSETQENQKLTFEFTSNPAWLAFMTLPYLRENPYDCYEQLFSKLYANSVARKIISSNPEIEKTFEKLSEEDFKSALEKNQELKSIMLNETPWLIDAKNESENMKEIAHLFNEEEINNSNMQFIKKLKDGQYSNGGWPWFAQMHESDYITQYILAGFGKLISIGAIEKTDDVKQMTEKAISFIDNELTKNYNDLKKIYKNSNFENYIPGNYVIQYFYARSFFKDIKIPNSTKEAYNFFEDKIIKNWTSYPMYSQAILATTMKRIGKQEVAQEIIKSFQNNAQYSDEFGMYYSKNINGYQWYNSPIETQSAVIEAFAEFGMSKEVEELKIWLIKNKQTNSWKSTRATTEAVYALLMNGEKYSSEEKKCGIKIGEEVINQDDATIGEAYIKKYYSPQEITSEKSDIEIVNPNNHIAFGATYLQYFVDFDDVKSTSNGLTIEKKVYIVKKNNLGEDVLTEISSNTIIHQGDKLKARLLITTDRDLEYVFLKDHHSSGFEPLNKLSGVRYQDGLIYYESTKDASEEFFVEKMERGTYVFEYPLVAVHKGIFTNGIATIECMYSPEFRANSTSAKIKVE